MVSQIQIPVHILGNSGFQNNLLAQYLTKELELSCDFHQSTKLETLCQNCIDDQCLILCDCQGPESINLWHCRDGECRCKTCNGLFVLFNVIPDSGIEKIALARDIAGVFYRIDSLYTLTKGIQCILNGELWFSRKVLMELVNKSAISSDVAHSTANQVTTREKEILRLIVSGATNEEIKTELVISLHTVKSHLYNIYRKIHVDNRTQAAKWAAVNLFHK